MSYDCTDDTVAHQMRVAELIECVIDELAKRADEHDESKLSPEEKPLFDEYTPRLKELTYGSDEYKKCLEGLAPALEHHYSENRHHPEYFDNGVCDMNLIDLIEMLCDWKAATERHGDGDIQKSLEHNESRFEIPEALMRVLSNTAEDLGMV